MSTSYPPKKPPPPYSNGKAPKASAYQPLATEEDWDGDADEADLEARIAPEFRYTRRGPILELEDSKATRSPERLFELFKSQMPTSQSFSLRIIGYRPKHGDERERERITFNFVVPLPDCIADAATICALPPDAPCYRGQALSSLELDDILTEQQELAQARGNVQLQNVATDEPISAPRSVIERWNARTHIGTQPPWLPLDPSLPAREGDATLGTAERLSFSTKGGRIRSMLQTFCEHRTSTKCLLGRHFLYGWDIVALQEALLKLAREEAGLGPAALERVSVAVEDERPWLALRVFSPLVHKMVRLRMNTQIYVITMFIASFFVSIVSLVYMLNEIGPQWMVPIFCPILIAFSVITITLANKKTHCFDGIGLAWCLKRWRSTGLPQSFSREEVLAELDKRQRQNVPEESEYTATAALDRSQTYLQRRTDGWYVLEGTREGDWLNLHRAKLVSAFQTHRTGDLHGEISEASNKEQEVWDEQDDAFGL